jgi:hypothetical protein
VIAGGGRFWADQVKQLFLGSGYFICDLLSCRTYGGL